ncbi:MAG: hypothetical protein ACM3NH_01985, partial [Candidatus Saccharibacteria bacterium]
MLTSIRTGSYTENGNKVGSWGNQSGLSATWAKSRTTFVSGRDLREAPFSFSKTPAEAGVFILPFLFFAFYFFHVQPVRADLSLGHHRHLKL